MFLLFVRYLHGGHDGRRMPSESEILSFELRIMRQGALWFIHFWIDIVRAYVIYLDIAACSANLGGYGVSP